MLNATIIINDFVELPMCRQCDIKELILISFILVFFFFTLYVSFHSGFADTSDDEASSLGVFTRDSMMHDGTKSEDAWTDRSSVTPPFTSKKTGMMMTPTTSLDNGETTLLSVFSLQSFGFTSLFNT